MRVAALAALLLMLSGCTTAETTHVEWTIRNDSADVIAFEARLRDADESYNFAGSLAPGEATTRTMFVAGPNMDAQARIVEPAGAWSGASLRIDTLCRYSVGAAWDGTTWSVEPRREECR